MGEYFHTSEKNRLKFMQQCLFNGNWNRLDLEGEEEDSYKG